jgi:hypothetical protein
VSRGVFPVLGYAGYVATVAALLIRVTTGIAAISSSGSEPAEAVDRSVASGQPIVLTITVDGPKASVDIYCATTTDRAPFDHLQVSPEQVMDAFHRWCSPGPDYS